MLAAARTLLHLAVAAAQDRRHHLTTPVPADIQPWLTALDQQGFVVVPHFYPPMQCAGLRAEVDRILRQYPATTEHLPDDDRIYAAERVSALIGAYHADPRLVALADAFHQAPALNLFTLANRVRPVPGGLGSGGGWHRDSVHQRQLKTLLYLTDVHDGTGAYQYIAGSHHPADLLRLARAGRVAFNQSRLTENNIAAIEASGGYEPGAYRRHTVTGAAGTLVITDTRGLHRGQPLTHGIRYALTNYFFARHHLSAGSETRFRKLFVDRDQPSA